MVHRAHGRRRRLGHLQSRPPLRTHTHTHTHHTQMSNLPVENWIKLTYENLNGFFVRSQRVPVCFTVQRCSAEINHHLAGGKESTRDVKSRFLLHESISQASSSSSSCDQF